MGNELPQICLVDILWFRTHARIALVEYCPRRRKSTLRSEAGIATYERLASLVRGVQPFHDISPEITLSLVRIETTPSPLPSSAYAVAGHHSQCSMLVAATQDSILSGFPPNLQSEHHTWPIPDISPGQSSSRTNSTTHSLFLRPRAGERYRTHGQRDSRTHTRGQCKRSSCRCTCSQRSAPLQ